MKSHFSPRTISTCFMLLAASGATHATSPKNCGWTFGKKAFTDQQGAEAVEELVILGGALAHAKTLADLGDHSKALLTQYLGNPSDIAAARAAFGGILERKQKNISTPLGAELQRLGISRAIFAGPPKARRLVFPAALKKAAFLAPENMNAQLARNFGVEFLSIVISPSEYRDFVRNNGKLGGDFELVYRLPWENHFAHQLIKEGYPREVHEAFLQHQPTGEILSAVRGFDAQNGYQPNYRKHGQVMLLISPSALDRFPFSMAAKKIGGAAGVQRDLRAASSHVDDPTGLNQLAAFLAARTQAPIESPAPFDNKLLVRFDGGLPLGFVDAVIVPKDLLKEVEPGDRLNSDSRIVPANAMEGREGVLWANAKEADQVLWPLMTLPVGNTMPSGAEVLSKISAPVRRLKAERIQSLREEKR